jgi:hypothetical protein
MLLLFLTKGIPFDYNYFKVIDDKLQEAIKQKKNKVFYSIYSLQMNKETFKSLEVEDPYESSGEDKISLK